MIKEIYFKELETGKFKKLDKKETMKVSGGGLFNMFWRAYCYFR